jgi:hypothetical protein
MPSLCSPERDRWLSVFQRHFAETGLQLGEMHETGWQTVMAELLDEQNNVFLLAEVDFDTEELLRCRRPSGAAPRRS